MQPFRDLLVLPDLGGDLDAAVERAARLAEAWDAQVTLALPEAPEAAARLEAWAAPLRARGLLVFTRVLPEPFVPQASRAARRDGYDLVLVAVDGADGASPMADRLLRDSPASVLQVGPADGRPARQVLVGVDPDDMDAARTALSARALAVARAVALAEGATLHVVQAWQAPGERLVVLRADGDTEAAYYAEMSRVRAWRALARLVKPQGLDPAGPRVHLEKGPPDEVLPAVAADVAADLIVLGTVGRRGVWRRLLGSTAERVAHACPGALLTVTRSPETRPARSVARRAAAATTPGRDCA
ncbi:MAG: universal stress protein [Myxococcales bacterium]|nr:universal stress protein [Myxococcales bacterium]